MKILLTGINGQLGHALFPLLAQQDEVLAPGRAELDLGDATGLRELVRSVRPQLIINCAAYTAVDRAESEPALAMRINAKAPAVLAEQAQRVGAALLHFSTDYVFDGRKTDAWVEQDETHPLNVYGRSKREGELAIEAAGAAALVLRTQWIYSLRGSNFLLTMQRLGRERSELKVVDDQFGAPTWARSLAEAVAGVVAQGRGQPLDWWRQRGGIYHVAAGGSTSWCGFARRIFELAPPPHPVHVAGIPSAQYPTPAERPRNSRLSCEKFERRFGIGMPPWEVALAQCLAPGSP